MSSNLSSYENSIFTLSQRTFQEVTQKRSENNASKEDYASCSLNIASLFEASLSFFELRVTTGRDSRTHEEMQTKVNNI
jgi:hypothetical protein